MGEDRKSKGELVEFSYSMKDGNYIKKIYYEFETEKAVMFGRNLDEKILWLAKSIIRGGWSKDNKIPQNIKVKYPMKLYWKERKNIYLKIRG